MLLSRAKTSLVSNNSPESPHKADIPTLEQLLDRRDFTGALTLLEFQRSSKYSKPDPLNDQWIAYCYFHLGEFKKAAEEYKKILGTKKSDPIFNLYLACCYFFLGLYEEATELAKKSPDSALKNRVLFHCAHKTNDERQLLNFHNQLNERTEDQLCLAAIHFLRNHNQAAIDIYKRLILENRDFYALNVYIAICYYKIEYQDVANEVLSIYLQHYPDSATALNLRACINFKLYDGRTAENDIKTLQNQSSSSFSYAKDIIRHNQVVFRSGEDALQILTPLIGIIPEARLNLIIYHLKHHEIEAAFEIAKDIEPNSSNEYILKAVILAIVGQKSSSPVGKEYIKTAQQYFQLIGSSSSECDTVSGRQCMASCFFLLKQFDDVLMYLDSIKSFFSNDDTFNFNYGQAKAAIGSYKEAIEALQSVKSEKVRQEFAFISWSARCYIMIKQPKQAWELYLRMESSVESFTLLQLIAEDCYKTGAYYYAAKAFDVLERLDPSTEYWEGKRGACIAVFKDIIEGKERDERLTEIIVLLRSSNDPQSENIARIMKRYSSTQSLHEI